jgi:aquaporin Z
MNVKNNIQVCVTEAAGLAGFVIGAGLLTILLEHPELPVMQSSWKAYPTLRRVPLGIVLGFYIFIITKLFGKRSGAHINPAVTWTFFRLHKISFKNAVLYTIAQFTGAIGAAQILKYTVGYWFAHSPINYGASAPQPPHTSLSAFIAEFIISFLMMFMVLVATTSKQWEKKVPLFAGILIAAYIIVEMPFSGMSLNPARSTAAALAAGKFEHLWIYFISPVAAMLIAAEVFLWRDKSRSKPDKKSLPIYPSEK